eukprot:2724791-Rhodomonas_salina.1
MKQIERFTARLERVEEFKQKQVANYVGAAFGTSMAKAAIKSMNLQDSWREALNKKWGAGSSASSQTSSNDELIKLIKGLQGMGTAKGPKGGSTL